MTKTNDERILELKKQIEVKKEEIGKVARFNPITNCSIELDGARYNLNTLDEGKLHLLLVKLSSLIGSSLNLIEKKITEKHLEIDGYSILDWYEDALSKYQILKQKKEEQKLKQMENKLTQLLSERKKVELEIDEIESFLKE